MEESGKTSGSEPRQMGASGEKTPKVGLPATDASPNRMSSGQSVTNSDDRYRLIVEAAEQAGHGIVILQNVQGKEGVITFANRATEKALGYGQDELLGMTMADIIHPDSLPLAAERYRRRQSGGEVPTVYELSVSKRDGTAAMAAVSAVMTTIDGKPATALFITDVTERHLAEERLRASEEKYRLVTDNVNEGIGVFQDGKAVFGNPKFVEMVGVPKEELMSTSFIELVHPDDRQIVTERYLKTLAGEEIPTNAARTVDRAGNVRWVQANSAPFIWSGRPAVLALVTDITEGKQAEQALQLSEQKYRTLVESSPDGILSVDPQGCIVDCNTGICKLLGYTREDLKGTDVRQLVTIGAAMKGPSLRHEIDQTGYAEAEIEMVHRNARKIPVWARLVELKGTKDDDYQILVYLRDMQERKKVDQLKDQFIGLVSHELRTPLTVIMGAVNTALSEGKRLSQQETRDLLEDAASASESLSDILENLLELSRSQADRLTLHLEPVTLEEVIQKTIHEARRHSSVHQFVIDLPETLPALRADRIRLERILHNLVENAVKYSPGGEVRVSARQDRRHLLIAVHDRGPGISPEDQAKLFQPFQRIRQAEADGIKGIGLGLIVCRSLVEAHGGKIWVESKPGQGTIFLFTLPIEARRRK